jgi:Uma2 family endonuclease
MASQPLSYVSPEEYLARERVAETKSEYIDGEIVAMAGGTPSHSLIATNVSSALWNRLAGGNCLAFNSDARVSVQSGKLITYPDVSVVCDEVQYVDDHRDTITNPRVVVEVLSPSIANYDRGAKSRLYRMLPSLAEYLLVDQDTVEVELYRRLPNGHWEIATFRDADAIIRLESIGCDLPMNEIYRDVERLR